MKFHLNTPLVSNLEKKYVNDVLKSSWLSINGKHTKIFDLEKSNAFEQRIK